jgi:hypothetical protein
MRLRRCRKGDKERKKEGGGIDGKKRKTSIAQKVFLI